MPRRKAGYRQDQDFTILWTNGMKKNYMNCRCILLVTSLFIALYFSTDALYSQQYITATGATYRVFFRDKGGETFQRGSTLYARTEALLTPKALTRRRKTLPPERIITLADAPLHEPYLDSLRRVGASLLLRLRWNNYALVTCSTVQIEQIRRFPFVRAVQPATARLFPLRDAAIIAVKSLSSAEEALERISLKSANCGTLGYSDSRRQLQSINITPIHELGVAGKGVVIGVIDAGFRQREQNSLKGASILGEYDFIQNDSVTANQQTTFTKDLPDQDDHGTKVLSVMAAYSPQNLIGAAFDADYLLAKSEDLRYERHIEEDNAAAALEGLEARGADIINASLGYSTFDQPDESYRYEELDGKTSILTRAINDAVARGVLCVVSAGNEGRRGSRTLNAPADADSALTVAAIRADSAGVVNFSSRGPRGDGGIKPDIAAQGDSVIVAAPSGREFQYARGTSFSSPLIAGGAALLLSAFPELTSSDVRKLLKSSASQAAKPDTILGYGIANIQAAMRLAGTIVAPELVSYPLWDAQRIGISALPQGMTLRTTLYVRFADEQAFSPLPLRPFPPSTLYLADIPFTRFVGKSAQAYAVVEDATTSRRIPASGAVELRPRIASVPCGIPSATLPIEKPDNVQEGVVPSPISSDAGFATLLLTTPESATLEYTVYSTYGSPIASDTVQVTPGISTIPFAVNRFGRGVYFVQVRYNATIQVFRFVVN
ncbi:MAG: S8 family peptidase [Candidatus Kapaibacteriota bacterium]